MRNGGQNSNRIRVKVVCRKGRSCYVFRWRERSDGPWKETLSGVEVGSTQREKASSRRKAERAAADLEQELTDAPPVEASIETQLERWSSFVTSKGTGAQHIKAHLAKVRRFAEATKSANVHDIDADRVGRFLNKLTAGGISAQTSNHYLSALRQFCNHLVRDGVFRESPLRFMTPKNVEPDRRHVRRAFSGDEFGRLVAAAAAGPAVEGVSGPDRAMLYLLACWTGFRRCELAPLTLRHLRLDDEPPAILVGAADAKSRKKEAIPLHPVLVERVRAWLARRGTLSLDEPLFELRTAKGHPRKTAEMVRRDLKAARAAWLEEARDDPREKDRRERSEFLLYRAGDEIADFHAARHTFVTNLAIAGVSLQDAQRLARHSDPKLTANVYTHVEMSRRKAAIDRLPEPPTLTAAKPNPVTLRLASG